MELNEFNKSYAYDRISRYADYSMMEYMPEISVALDEYADAIYNEIKDIHLGIDKRILARNLCKYGDQFVLIDIKNNEGVTNMFPIPVNEIEREEGYNPNNPYEVRFRWVTQGNQILKNWQVLHFRLMSRDTFMPYGFSILEPARRIWRQLSILEDCMIKDALGCKEVAEVASSDKIEKLAGGQTTSMLDDLEYIQRKLFTALKIPKEKVLYTENYSLSTDIRWNRTISNISSIIRFEAQKLENIHNIVIGNE